MKLTIHQGANTLGGNCVELQTTNTSILLDAGIPVKEKDPALSSAYFNRIANRAVAIFVSHPHQDHYEMLKYLNRDIPVYMSRGCKKMIGIAHKFGQTEYNPTDAKVLDGQIIEIEDIVIKPFPVDHSGFDSRAFYIKNRNRTIVYSGDFRRHGRRNYLSQNLTTELSGKIDYLILEGTLLSRDYMEFRSEEAVREKLVSEFEKAERLILINYSSQNIDRLISVYKACLATKRTLVIDPYTAFILQEIKEFSNGIPQFFWNNIGILFANNSYTSRLKENTLFNFSNSKITKEIIQSHSDRFVIKTNKYVEDHIINPDQTETSALLIYSLWLGYAKGIWNRIEVQPIHTSGHAQIEHLEQTVNEINPKYIIPIHTEYAELYETIWGDKVKELENKTSITLD